MALTTAFGMGVYLITFRLHARRHNAEQLAEIKDATGNLFRVVGWLFTLLLSLTFTDVVSELSLTENAIQKEAAAIEDVYHNLRRLGLEETREARRMLAAYVTAVLEKELPQLANDQLAEEASIAWRQLQDEVLRIPINGRMQETLQAGVIADMDRVSDFRIARLQQAREGPSAVLYVVLFGFLVTMVYFGIYEPRRSMVALLTLYTVFVGVVIYLILAMADPFQGTLSVSSGPLEYTLELLKADSV